MSSSPCNLCAHPVRDDGTFRVSKIKSSRQRYGNGEIYWVDKSVDDIVLEVLSQHMGDTDAAALRCLLQSNQSSQTTKTAQLESGETTEADQPERGDRGNFVKRRPCVVMQGGSDTPVICVMATFGGTRYPHLSEIIKLLALPIWPISDRLPRNFAGGHVHSSPDMKSPDVNLKNTGKLHWRYVVLYPFTYTGAMYPPRHGDPLAIRRRVSHASRGFGRCGVSEVYVVSETRASSSPLRLALPPAARLYALRAPCSIILSHPPTRTS
jgi:hypothetical protein